MFLTFWVVYMILKDQILDSVHLLKNSWQVKKAECFLFFIIKAS